MEKTEKNSRVPQVVVKRIIHAELPRVFEAWTKPELMQHWMVGAKGHARVEADIRVGGKYSNEMILEDECAGNGGAPQTKNYLHHGEYLEISPPNRLVFTWNSPFVENTTVTVELREVDSGTEVTITHALAYEKDCEGHQKGWTYCLSSLAAFLG